MDSSEGPVSIYMSGGLRQGLAFSNFTDTLQFPGSINALPQQPCESFPFDFSLICTGKKKKKHFHLAASGCSCESRVGILCEGATFKHLTSVCSPACIQKTDDR